MIKVENIEVFNFKGAIRGMRNPLNSWDKSDSDFDVQYYDDDCNETEYFEVELGENDLGLMKRLYNAGPEHRKYLRQIFVSMDITAPLYWWKEFDTYKVGAAANSCSTMHTIHKKKFGADDFSCEHLNMYTLDTLWVIIDTLNHYREEFLKTKSKDAWWQMIQLLPSSYNQKRTVTMNYENVVSIIRQRDGHKLDEWSNFIEVLLKDLPYVKEIIGTD